MTENANQKGAQQKIDPPSEAYGSGSASGFLSEKAKNPKDGSDFLGGPQDVNEIPNQNDDGSGVAWSGRGKPPSGNLQVNDRGRVPGSTIEDPPEYNAEKAKNSQEGSDFLGGPQDVNEIPGNGGNSGNGCNSVNVQGVDTQTGSQAKGMGSDGYTKPRFNETPGNGSGNGGNG